MAERLKGRKIAVLGFGSQGSAQALNLRDSGHNVIIGIREGTSRNRAEAEGFEVFSVAEATKIAEVVFVLLPDEVQARVFAEEIAPNLKPKSALVFAHGLNIVFGKIKPKQNVDVLLCAPIGPGERLREEFLKGEGLNGMISVEQNATGNAGETLRELAKGIGLRERGIIKTTMREETVVDLFGEQAVLCGGVAGLVKEATKILRGKGYPQELIDLFVVKGLETTAPMISRYGVEGMYERVSNTAAFGSREFGEKVIGKESRAEMEKLLKRIESGEFAERWLGRKDGMGLKRAK